MLKYQPLALVILQCSVWHEQGSAVDRGSSDTEQCLSRPSIPHPSQDWVMFVTSFYSPPVTRTSVFFPCIPHPSRDSEVCHVPLYPTHRETEWCFVTSFYSQHMHPLCKSAMLVTSRVFPHPSRNWAMFVKYLCSTHDVTEWYLSYLCNSQPLRDSVMFVTSLYHTHRGTGRYLSRLYSLPITGLGNICHVSIPYPSRDWAIFVTSLLPTHRRTEQYLTCLQSLPITGLGDICHVFVPHP